MKTTTRPNFDVVVVGAGLHGLSSALRLGREGLSVAVLEKDHAGRHASGVNAGGVRRLGRHEAEIPLSVRALELWHSIEDEVGDTCGFTACGQVKVAENLSEAQQLKTRVQRLVALGYTHEEWIDVPELRQIVPNIGAHCVGAIICRRDGAANPFRTVMAFRRAASAAGVEIHEYCTVLALREAGTGWRVHSSKGKFTAKYVVNCAGAWGNLIADYLGEPVPVHCEAPMLMITERLQPFLKPVLGTAGRVLSFKQFENGTVLIGGGYRGDADPSCNRTTVRYECLKKSARTVSSLFPQLHGVRIMRTWAGLEGVMPDAIPVIGASSKAEGVFHAFGFSAHGFQLSPVTGIIIADLILRDRSSLPISPFAIDRFARATAVEDKMSSSIA